MKQLFFRRNFWVLLLGGIFLFIFPFANEAPPEKTPDLTWQKLNRVQTIHRHKSGTLEFKTEHKLHENTLELHEKEIRIKGFLRYDKVNKHWQLTESADDVCFFCNHDHLHQIIHIVPDDEAEFTQIAAGSYLQLRGILKINADAQEMYIYQLHNAIVEELLRQKTDISENDKQHNNK